MVEWEKHDRYGRTVGVVLVDGRDANLEQVRAVMAWWYRYYANIRRPLTGDFTRPQKVKLKNCEPTFSPSFCINCRATMSSAPPGGACTTTRTGFSG